MRWKTDIIRCVRRFAFLPILIYDPESGENITIWLEPYYVIQSRCVTSNDHIFWENRRLASKIEYIAWNRKEKTNAEN